MREHRIGLFGGRVARAACLVVTMVALGWSVAGTGPHPTSQLVYVDPLFGDDTNSGQSSTDPFATVERGLAALRPGEPDWLHLRRTTDAPLAFDTSGLRGASADWPVVITSYGVGPMPVLDLSESLDDLNARHVRFREVIALPPPATDVPVLQPGDGWTDEAPTLGPVGESSAPGADATVIARWNTVPYQVFDGLFEVGVVAFHMNGIDRVEFSVDGGPWASTREMTVNPRTGTEEYWVRLDASLFDGTGPVEVRAVAWPAGAGIPRALSGPMTEANHRGGEFSLVAYAGAGLPEPREWYVSPRGDDGGDGSSAAPFRTLARAIEAAGHHDDIVLTEAGTYELGVPRKHEVPADDGGYTLHVRAADGLRAEEVVIVQPTRSMFRPYTRIRWTGVSFDSALLSQYYLGEPWFDRCVFFDSEGWMTETRATTPVRGPYFVTNSIARDKIYGFPSATLLRNVQLARISGDAFQNAGLLVDCTLSDMDGGLLDHHTDVLQTFGQTENIIYYGLLAEGLVQTQSIFLEPTYQSTVGAPVHWMKDCAFVNVRMMNEPAYWSNGTPRGGTPYSQLISRFDHVIFRGLDLPNQQLMIRTDFEHNQRFHARNLIFERSRLFPDTVNRYATDGNVPEGVIFRDVVPSNGAETTLRDPVSPD